MDRERIKKILDGFEGRRILVIGDVMLDKYIEGDVSRISHEAPVQVVDERNERYVPGGAANVANNICALGGTACVIGLIGRDDAGEVLESELGKRGIDTQGILTDPSRPTIQKVRVLGMNQQLLRIDFEEIKPMDDAMVKEALARVRELIADIDLVVVSDYAKGAITGELLGGIYALCKSREIPVIVDPKPKNKGLYRGASLITPNMKEAGEMSGIYGKTDADVAAIGKKLAVEFDSTILITRGKDGMSLYTREGNITHIPTRAKEVYDVSGAGDTVIGTIALALAAKASLEDAAILANHAAGITVGKLGTSTVSLEELKVDIDHEIQDSLAG